VHLIVVYFTLRKEHVLHGNIFGSSLYRVGGTIKYPGDGRHAGSFAIRVSRCQVLNLTPFSGRAQEPGSADTPNLQDVNAAK